MADNIGTKLLNYRIKNKKTQLEIADSLGVTQVHVSRIEKGLTKLSPALMNKIASLLGEKLRISNMSLVKIADKGWSISYYTMANDFSGDRVIVNKELSEKIYVAHVDSEGHDSAAIDTSNTFEIVFEAIVASSTSQEFTTPTHIVKSLDRTAKGLKKKWKVSSSCNVFALGRSNNVLSYLNAGMPSMYHYVVDERKVKLVDGLTKTRPVGELLPTQAIVDTNILMQRGDVLASFSDGFLEFFKRSFTITMEDYLSSIAKSLRGDAEGIGSKLLKDVTINENKISTSDDLSFVIFGKN